MTTLVRLAGSDDLDAVVAIEQAVFGAGAWSRQSVEEELTGLADTRLTVVAEESDPALSGEAGVGSDAQRSTVVGFAVGRYVGGVADISRVAVLPAHRHTGVGSRLLSQLVAAAGRRRCDRVLLEVGADNRAALALYDAAGFETIDRRPRYYPGDLDALVMQRCLPRLATVVSRPERRPDE